MKATKLEIGVRSQESGEKSQEKRVRRKKSAARRSVFTNMRCSQSPVLLGRL
ncbi:hypothetical protein QUA81_16680 [Microcoleus sp. F6_B4]